MQKELESRITPPKMLVHFTDQKLPMMPLLILSSKSWRLTLPSSLGLFLPVYLLLNMDSMSQTWWWQASCSFRDRKEIYLHFQSYFIWISTPVSWEDTSCMPTAKGFHVLYRYFLTSKIHFPRIRKGSKWLSISFSYSLLLTLCSSSISLLL